MRFVCTWSGVVAIALSGCVMEDGAQPSQGLGGRFEEGSTEALAIQALVNDPTVDRALLDDDVGLDARAAQGIVAHRDGTDAVPGTGDDDLFDNLAELDQVAYVGDSAFDKLYAYAEAHGYVEGDTGEALTQAQIDAAALALVNDPAVDAAFLDVDVALDSRAATNIVAHRNGADAAVGTSDDDPFDSITELDAVSYVGESALALLRDYAVDNGYAVDGSDEVPVGRPTLATAVQYENTWCSYGDSAPYVRDVAWDNPDVKAAMSALTAGYRSTFTYTEWNVAYDLESDNLATEQDVAFARARNFMRVICGEHRDYPEMIGHKLRAIAQHTTAASPLELTSVDTTKNLFDQLTYPAYAKLVNVMGTMHSARSVAGSLDGYHYGFGEWGHGSRRVDHSVPPFTQCEMKFVFENYLVAGAPSTVVPSQYEASYASYRTANCTDEDLSYMFNFRGHVNFQPLWLESNAFVFNSRRARGAELSRDTNESYLHPFAWRYQRAREAWAAYLFYRDADHDALIQASESGGGPILYITDQDTDHDGLADYRLFSKLGCGDNGVSLSVPSQNCNMVDWSTAWTTANTTGHASSFDPTWWSRPDMGFMTAFTTFDDRMARLNQALDRHTNWGPTGYYMLDASDPGDTSPRFFGAYSPIVAASYDVSASDFFVRRDYDSTDPFEQGYAKWLFVMRFPVSSYYDEADLAAGQAIDFDRYYFNETSLSNDYYNERALDHWGYIEGEEMYAQVYLTYGDRGEQPPEPAVVPAP